VKRFLARPRHRARRYDVGFYVPTFVGILAGNRGGAEIQALLLCRALAKYGFAVRLVAASVPGLGSQASDQGVDFLIRPPYLGGGNIRRRLREVATVRRTVREIDARIVITRGSGYHVGLIGLWTKLFRHQFVYTSASLLDFKRRGLLKRRDRYLFRLGVALADKIVVQTEEQVELCRQRFGKVPILIRSISEPAEQSEHEREAFLWVGRVEPNKQPLEYVELARSLPGARFWMVAPAPDDPWTVGTPLAGTSELWAKVEQAAQTLPNLELLPSLPRSELLDLIARAVAVVSTSEYEGMPNIFLEGWVRGIPALALHHDPDGIISRHRLGGFAQGRRDGLVELARELWDGRNAPLEYAARCRAYVHTNHSPEVVSAEWARVLRSLNNRPAESFAPRQTFQRE
jgi:glycosyltransferase involved in cell wall biosynthesis